MGKILPGKTIVEKLKLNVAIEGACWRWIGAHTANGYGHLRVEGIAKRVHRLAFECWVGSIPDGTEIDHKCNVRDCVNPDHLQAVSHAENVTLTWARNPVIHCPQGHEMSGSNIKWACDGRQRRCRRCFNDRRNRVRAARRQGNHD